MPNHNESFEKRMSVNIAEDKALKFYKSQNIKIARCGFDYQNKEQRIEKEDFFKIPELIRCLPDYIIMVDRAYLLEVKGCNDLLKVKIKDMHGYDFWEKIVPLVFFIYSSSLKHCYRVRYDRLKEVLFSIGKKGIYPNDNKQYYGIEPKELTLIGENCKW